MKARYDPLMSPAPGVLNHEPAATFATSAVGLQRHRLTTLGLGALFGASLILVAVGYALDTSILRLVGVLGAVFFGVSAQIEVAVESGPPEPGASSDVIEGDGLSCENYCGAGVFDGLAALLGGHPVCA